ncbi:hypothetical protein, partial [Dapis sp. BLCC M229]|uniref:hypothetical protein n=1 Tax=Dapis sp. BLCC M229 TaxID=3400188 RepID=UPI003CFAA1FE
MRSLRLKFSTLAIANIFGNSILFESSEELVPPEVLAVPEELVSPEVLAVPEELVPPEVSEELVSPEVLAVPEELV